MKHRNIRWVLVALAGSVFAYGSGCLPLEAFNSSFSSFLTQGMPNILLDQWKNPR